MVFREASFSAPERPTFALGAAIARHRGALLFAAAAVLLATGSRALLHDVIQHDPPFYAEVARLWRGGVLPYVGTFDVKPPGLFALFALAQALFGDTYLTAQVLQILSEVAVAIALRSIGVRLGSSAVGAFAGSMYIVCAAFAVLNNAGYAPFVALTAFGVRAVLDFDGRSLRPVWIAGLLLGLAFTIKQTVAVPGFALFCLLVTARAADGRRLAVAALYLVAAAAPALGFCIYFAAHGALAPMLEQTVAAALFRASGGPDDMSYLEGAVFFVLRSLPVLPVFWMAALAIARQRALRGVLPNARFDVIAWWFAAEVFVVLLQRAALRHYLSPVLAPGLLLMGALALLDSPMWRARETRHKFALLVGACLLCAPMRFSSMALRDDNPTLARIAAAVDRFKAPGDRILVTNDALWLYTMTSLHPARPIFNPMHLLCAFPSVGADPMQSMFDARPRFVVVRRAFQGDVGCALPERWATFDREIAAGYGPAATFPTTEGHYELFTLKAEAPAR